MTGAETPLLEAGETWDELVALQGAKARLKRPLILFLRRQRWYAGKSKKLKSLQIRSAVPVRLSSGTVHWCALQVEHAGEEPESYQVPLAFVKGETARKLLDGPDRFLVARARLGTGGEEGAIVDAVALEEYCVFLLRAMKKRRRLKGLQEILAASSLSGLRRSLAQRGDAPFEIRLGSGEESNTTIIYGQDWILKLFRRLEDGVHPELEILRLLTKKRFSKSPALGGWFEKEDRTGDRVTLAVVTEFVPGCKDGWVYTLDSLGAYYERVQSLPPEKRRPPESEVSLAELVAAELPEDIKSMLGAYVESARQLGLATAAFHSALASETRDAAFAPEPLTPHYQKSLLRSMRSLTARTMRRLRESAGSLPKALRRTAEKAASTEAACIGRFREILGRRIQALRIRVHGDFHLGQVIHTGKDFLIIDFEGEPARSLAERRMKRSPLCDVAGMLRSFDYAAHFSLREAKKRGSAVAAKVQETEAWARYWRRWAGVIFLKAYLERARGERFLPPAEEDLWALLEAHLLEKTIYEVGYELDHRPDWLPIPLAGLLDLLGDSSLFESLRECR